MRSPVETILHAALSQQSEERRSHLIRFLPEKEQQLLNAVPFLEQPESIVNPWLENGATLLEKVHWSWFLPTLKSYSLQEQSLFLAALDKRSADNLALQIPCKPRPEELTLIGSAYLRQVLLDSLIGPHDRIVPMEALPPSPLNQLLELPKSKFISLIDLLAMHDLASEIRQIVETKILKKLYSALTEPQRKFLKQIAPKPEPFTLPKIGLDRWDGTAQELHSLLHRRGLARLGIALSLSDPALIWYACHQLDIGRGTALFKLTVREASSMTVEAALRQVIELLEYESL